MWIFLVKFLLSAVSHIRCLLQVMWLEYPKYTCLLGSMNDPEDYMCPYRWHVILWYNWYAWSCTKPISNTNNKRSDPCITTIEYHPTSLQLSDDPANKSNMQCSLHMIKPQATCRCCFSSIEVEVIVISDACEDGLNIFHFLMSLCRSPHPFLYNWTSKEHTCGNQPLDKQTIQAHSSQVPSMTHRWLYQHGVDQSKIHLRWAQHIWHYEQVPLETESQQNHQHFHARPRDMKNIHCFTCACNNCDS